MKKEACGLRVTRLVLDVGCSHASLAELYLKGRVTSADYCKKERHMTSTCACEHLPMEDRMSGGKDNFFFFFFS